MSSTTTVPSPNAFGTAIPHLHQGSSQSAASSTIASGNVPATTSSVRLGKEADISTTQALKQSFVKTNPIYANSFGAQAFERTTAYGSEIIGWRVTGKAQQRWERLEPSLLSLLVSKREVLYSKRPPGIIMDPPCALRCFILGPDKDHATPYATVLCGMSWLRKAMGELIKKSGLLIPDGFKCCGLPDKPELYGGMVSKVNHPERPIITGKSDDKLFGERSQNKQPPDYRAIRPLEGFDMRSIPEPGSASGRPVEIYHNDNPIGGATIGGVIRIDDRRFEMTVRHVFRPPPLPLGNVRLSVFSDTSDVKGPDGPEIDLFDSDCESDDASDTDEGIQESAPGGSQQDSRVIHTLIRWGRTTWGRTAREQEETKQETRDQIPHAGMAAVLPAEVPTAASLIGRGPESFHIYDVDRGSRLKEIQDGKKAIQDRLPSMQANISPSPYRPILASPNPELDWALREVASGSSFDSFEDFMMRSNVSFANPDEFRSVDHILIKTPSHPKTGIPDSTGIIGPIPIDDKLSIPPQRVQVVSLAEDSEMIPGECGSWAMSQYGEFTGMLIGSCPSLGEAYLLPMSEILDDISKQTGLSAKIASTTETRFRALKRGT
ncbi:hypothetical protein V8F33_000836 [Rhypophila sp. PSN 637]